MLSSSGSQKIDFTGIRVEGFLLLSLYRFPVVEESNPFTGTFKHMFVLQRTFRLKFKTACSIILSPETDQWRGESEAAGKAALLMAPPPPPVILFCLLVWDACHVVGTTVGRHCALHIWVDAGARSPSAVSWYSPGGGPGGSPPGSSKESASYGTQIWI